MGHSGAEFLIRLPRFAKRAMALVTDVLLCFISVQTAFYLRLGEWQPVDGRPLYSTIATIVLAIPLFITNGLYRAIFRFSAISAIRVIAKAVVLFTLPFAVVFTFIGVPGTPRTIGIIEPILLFLSIAGVRGVAHWWLGTTYGNRFIDPSRPRAVIYGGGDAAFQLASAIQHDRGLRLIGFVDEDQALHGSTIAGIPVLSPAILAAMLEDGRVDEVLLAAPNLNRSRRMRLVEDFTSTGARVRILPAIMDIVRGRISVSDLKHVEIEDLLSRKTAPVDSAMLDACLRDRVVMVTGAGGSIGSELCRQIVSREPRRLVLIDAAEFNLYTIENELQALIAEQNLNIELVPLLASVRDRARLATIFATEQPEAIFHAAAYKHVPLVENNPIEGIATNVLGTFNMVELALASGTNFFILISSDKAVRPTNVMGASKRMAELVVQAFAAENPGRKFSMVRFGNVLGSSGSVVPLFRKQIAAGGPVTITHPEITRYFMTIPEAAQLVIQAGAMACGGEVFVLDMGRPLRILDMARNMIQLSGLTVRDEANPDGDIELRIIGVRPGEKLYEELLIGENPEHTSHRSIMKAREHSLRLAELASLVSELEVAVGQQAANFAVQVLKRAVPEFRPDLGGPEALDTVGCLQ